MIRNKYIVPLVAAFMLVITGCEKELLDQVNPNAVTTGNFWKSEADFDQGLNEASERGHIDIVNLMIENGANDFKFFFKYRGKSS